MEVNYQDLLNAQNVKNCSTLVKENSKSCQTCYELMKSSSTFQMYNSSISKYKNSEGYIDLDNFPQNFKSNDKEKLLMNQLQIRDKIIINFLDEFDKILQHGKKLELDLEYLQFKVGNNEEEIKKLTKEIRRKKKLLKNVRSKNSSETELEKLDKSIQTDEEKYDDSAWNDYYNNYYYSTHYNDPFYYNNHWESDKDMQDIENGIKCASMEDDTETTEPEHNSQCNDNEGESLEIKENPSDDRKLKVDQLSGNANVNSIDVDKESFHCDPSNIKEEKEGSHWDPSNIKEDIEASHWDPSNIKEDVLNVAQEVTNQLGFVYMDEIGMYYDHSSGYYYDHKTSLYYDSNSGTYFYYNQETNNYEFYSQVSPVKRKSKVPSSYSVKNDSIRNNTEKEEGECSDSEDEAAEEIVQNTNMEENTFCSDGESMDVAPSLRIMVMNGDEKGQLHIITIHGGFIGRKTDCHVILKDLSVSEVHAKISYKSEGLGDHHYYIKDVGSNNGTLIRGNRISESRQESELVEIGHGWKIQCANVILTCHIHPGLLTCNECEPGLIEGTGTMKDKSVSLADPKSKLEKERRRQNKVIKKKFSLGWTNVAASQVKSNYKNRAEKRREEVGSDNPFEKTSVASIHSSLTKENKGFQLLQKMGWSEGESLGTKERGIIEPVCPISLAGRAGLGSSCPVDIVDKNTMNMKGNTYNKMLIQTKERYERASLLPEVGKCNEEQCYSSEEKANHESTEPSVGVVESPFPTFRPIKFSPASHSSNGS